MDLGRSGLRLTASCCLSSTSSLRITGLGLVCVFLVSCVCVWVVCVSLLVFVLRVGFEDVGFGMLGLGFGV